MTTPGDPDARVIEIGTVMIQDGTLLPDGIGLHPRIYSYHWRSFSREESSAAEAKLRRTGWSCASIAGDLTAFAFGHGPGNMRDDAIDRLLGRVRTQDYNAMQLTAIVKSSFLGIPYTVLHASPRHIQAGFAIDDAAERKRRQNQDDWAKH
jgi:hypothetical protein